MAFLFLNQPVVTTDGKLVVENTMEEAGTYEFQLVVTDEGGNQSDPVTVTVTVVAPLPPPPPPPTGGGGGGGGKETPVETQPT